MKTFKIIREKPVRVTHVTRFFDIPMDQILRDGWNILEQDICTRDMWIREALTAENALLKQVPFKVGKIHPSGRYTIGADGSPMELGRIRVSYDYEECERDISK